MFVSAAKASRDKFKGLGSVFKGCGGLADPDGLSNSELISPPPGGIREGCAFSLGPAPPFGFENLKGRVTDDGQKGGTFEGFNSSSDQVL